MSDETTVESTEVEAEVVAETTEVEAAPVEKARKKRTTEASEPDTIHLPVVAEPEDEAVVEAKNYITAVLSEHPGAGVIGQVFTS